MSAIPIFHNHKLNKNVTYNINYSNTTASHQNNKYKLLSNTKFEVCVRCLWLGLFNNITDTSIHSNTSNYFTFLGQKEQVTPNTIQIDTNCLNARSPPIYS